MGFLLLFRDVTHGELIMNGKIIAAATAALIAAAGIAIAQQGGGGGSGAAGGSGGGPSSERATTPPPASPVTGTPGPKSEEPAETRPVPAEKKNDGKQ
jgi:hypothetical protein